MQYSLSFALNLTSVSFLVNICLVDCVRFWYLFCSSCGSQYSLLPFPDMCSVLPY